MIEYIFFGQLKMQPNKSKTSNTRKIKGIIKKKYNEEEQ